MVGETPNIDRIANEGARFMTYYAEQSCTAGRTAFFTGMHPLRAGMVMPQLPGSHQLAVAGHAALAKFLLDLGYNTGEFGKNHLGDKPRRCRPRTASRSSGAISITSTPCRG
jgi:arylsulfatase A-like enzyme